MDRGALHEFVLNHVLELADPMDAFRLVVKEDRRMSLVQDIRSKNAGPFWITIDVFCADAAAFARLNSALTTAMVAQALNADLARVQRFDIAALNVIKFSAPREVVQGSRADRDMHGASYAVLIKELVDAL